VSNGRVKRRCAATPEGGQMATIARYTICFLFSSDAKQVTMAELDEDLSSGSLGIGFAASQALRHLLRRLQARRVGAFELLSRICLVPVALRAENKSPVPVVLRARTSFRVWPEENKRTAQHLRLDVLAGEGEQRLFRSAGQRLTRGLWLA
jgi:hypothetical protein